MATFFSSFLFAGPGAPERWGGSDADGVIFKKGACIPQAPTE